MNYCARILRRFYGTVIDDDGLQPVSVYGSLPLEPAQHEIRLLEIHPGDFDADIECTLLKSSLDNNKVYRALSYHWGESTHRCFITVNGQGLSITTNLDIALRHLRHQELRLVIWCDAICINQADIKERNQQVLQMTEIYSSASQVIAWLGPAERDSDVAMDVLGSMMSNKYDISREDFRQGLKALIDLFRRPWWSRVWIVQEFTVAQIEPLLCCGLKSLPFSALILFMDAMRSRIEDVMTDFDDFDMLDEVWKATTNAVPPLLACRRAYWDNYQRTLQWLLFMTISFQSTDERDKIYAILGLITQHDEPRLRVDYSVPVGQLFREVTKHIIITEDNLDILSFHRLRPRLNLPSWVSDFAAFSRDPGGSISAPFSMMTGEENKTNNRVRASGNFRPNIYISQDITTLRAEGFHFDVITEVIDLKPKMSPDKPDELFTELASSLRSLKSQANRLRRQIKPTDPRRFLNEPGFDFLPNAFRNGNPISNLTKLDLDRRWKTLLAENGIPSEFRSGEDPQSRYLEYIWPVLRIFTFWLSNRYVFITSAGSIGLGPKDTRRGDEVVILFGASVPFVLRRRIGHHILLGDCAVSAIMEGEMACIFEHALHAADGLPSRFFTLR
jgi:hypothetical protein